MPGERITDQQAAVNGSIAITDEQGQLVPYVMPMYQTCGAPRPLGPGGRAVIFEKLDIASQYEIVKPGTYQVRFTGAGLSVGPATAEEDEGPFPSVGLAFASNTVEIEVKAE